MDSPARAIFHNMVFHDFQHWLGLDNASGAQYLFWSGCMGDIFIFGAMYTWYKRHNCHVQKCWKLGKHSVNGRYIVCKAHHPNVPDKISVNHIEEEYAKENS